MGESLQPFHYHFSTFLARPRLACIVILQAQWDAFLLLMGICCSTFVAISRGSTCRSLFLPEGRPVSLAVYKANKGLCRQGVNETVGLTMGTYLGESSVVVTFIEDNVYNLENRLDHHSSTPAGVCS